MSTSYGTLNFNVKMKYMSKRKILKILNLRKIIEFFTTFKYLEKTIANADFQDF